MCTKAPSKTSTSRLSSRSNGQRPLEGRDGRPAPGHQGRQRPDRGRLRRPRRGTALRLRRAQLDRARHTARPRSHSRTLRARAAREPERTAAATHRGDAARAADVQARRLRPDARGAEQPDALRGPPPPGSRTARARSDAHLSRGRRLLRRPCSQARRARTARADGGRTARHRAGARTHLHRSAQGLGGGETDRYLDCTAARAIRNSSTSAPRARRCSSRVSTCSSATMPARCMSRCRRP